MNNIDNDELRELIESYKKKAVYYSSDKINKTASDIRFGNECEKTAYYLTLLLEKNV